ncbi:MAG: AIPR family protein [Clostridia bacterium]|nr:AIPR family protein [Clostridia bacterium]
MENQKFTVNVKEFKKMSSPNYAHSDVVKYVCYVQCSSIDPQLSEWMGTNPREQKMTTNVAKKISDSLKTCANFHELNRGLVLSVEDISYDNKSNTATFSLSNPELHGDIDGGHTLKAIFDLQEKNSLSDDRYVFVEFFTGLTSTVELAEARNTSVQVDLKSIEELKNSFDVLKEAFKGLPFENRIQYKMNEYYNDDVDVIDIREIISILLMFSQEVYPITDGGVLSEQQPIQCYSGKEASLRKFLNLGKDEREKMIKNMTPIIPQIFSLWETIEVNFANKTADANKRYGTRKYSKFDGGKVIGKSFFEEKDLIYYIPKGLMYPLVGAFRSLVRTQKDHTYEWKVNPFEVWDKLGSKLTGIILDEKMANPDVIAKNANLWSNLFKEIYIYAYVTSSIS